jgi:hypothetical protein
MKKVISFFTFILAGLIILLGILPLLFIGKASDMVKAQCDQHLEAQVDFDKLSLSLLRHFPRLTVTLNGLEVVGVDTFSQDTLVKADKIRLVVNLGTILSKEGVNIQHIQLVKPRINALVLADGRANWNITKPDTLPKTPSEDSSTVRLQLRRISIEDAIIAFEDKSSGMNAAVEHWTGTLKGDLSAAKSRIETASLMEALSFEYAGIEYVKKLRLEADLALEADFEHSVYTLSTNTIRLNAMEFGLKGSVAMPDTSTLRMDLDFNTDKVTFKDVLSLVPALYKKQFDALQANGAMTLSASLKGDLTGEHYPAFNLNMSVKDGAFRYPGLPGSVENVNLLAKVDHPEGVLDLTVVDLKGLHLEMAGHPIDLRARVVTPISDPAVEAAFKGVIKLDRVKEVYPLEEGTDLQGTITGDVTLAGRLSQLEKKQYDQFKADGVLEASGVAYGLSDGQRLLVEQAKMTLSPAAIDLAALVLKLGRNDVAATGSLGNYLPWLMNKGVLTGRLDIRSNYLSLNELMNLGGDAEPVEKTSMETNPTTVSSDSVPLEAPVIPANLDLNLKADVATLVFNRFELKDFNGLIRIKESRAALENLQAKAMGGSIGVQGYYETVQPDKPAMDLKLNLKEVTYKETFKTLTLVRDLVPVFEKTEGTYSMNMQLKSGLDKTMKPDYSTLYGDGRLQSTNLKLSGLKVMEALATQLKMESLRSLAPKNVDIGFHVENGRVRTKPFQLAIQQTVLQFEGSSGFDKTLDYGVTAQLPASMSKVGLTTLKGRIGGTFDKPTVTFDLEEAAKKAAMGLADQLLKKATGAGIDEQAAKAKEAFEKEAAAIRARAKAAGDKLIAEADKEAQRLIDKATNPLLKAAAKASADQLKKEAAKKAAELEADAEAEISKRMPSL